MGKNKKIKFGIPSLRKELPISKQKFSEQDLDDNFVKIYREAQSIIE